MELDVAKRILSVFADGINPLTGEVLSSDDSGNQVEIVRAIYTVLKALEVREKVTVEDAPENAGKPWSSADDEKLCEMFDSGVTQKELCDYFKRSRGSISARLVKLGKIEK